MQLTRALVPTAREAPADASDASHALLVRAGCIRKVASGLHAFLPLGQRVLRKVEALVQRELERAGALEVLLPWRAPVGSEPATAGGPEEVLVELARRELRSYRDLPRILYQVQPSLHEPTEPRGARTRSRELLRCEAWSFDADEEGAARSHEAVRDAYARVLERLGLAYRRVQGDAGADGRSCEELQIPVDTGEDCMVTCDRCEHATSAEVATAGARADVESASPTAARKPATRVHTPGHGTIEAVATFLGVAPHQVLKSLLYGAGDDVVMAVVRGDHEVNPVLLARAVGAEETRLASGAEVQRVTGAGIGFAGPLGFTGRILVDRAAARVRDGVTGANETDHHLTGVDMTGHAWKEVVDLRRVQGGEPCPACASGALVLRRSAQVARLVAAGSGRCEALGARFVDAAHEQHPLVMGRYAMGLTRLLALVVEQHHDDDGVRWPMSIAPYQVHLVTIGREVDVLERARELDASLEEAGVEVLWDDRDERPGAKFKDADLMGIPLRVTLGARALAGGNVELKARAEADPKKAELVPFADATRVLAERVRAALE